MYVRSSDQALLSRFAYRRHSAEAVAAAIAVIVIAATTPIAVFMTGLPFRFDAPALARNAPYGDRAMDMPWADVHKIARLRRITGSFLASRLQFPSPEVPQT